MKKIILALSLCTLISCDEVKDSIESKLEDSIEIPPQEVSEEFDIPMITEIGETTLDPINVDVSALNDVIDEYTTDNYSLDELLVEGIDLSITEDGHNFDFLEDLEIIISSGDLAGTVLASVDDIPDGATELTLDIPEDLGNLLDLLENDNFDIEITVDVNDILDESIPIEFTSEFLAGLDIEL